MTYLRRILLVSCLNYRSIRGFAPYTLYFILYFILYTLYTINSPLQLHSRPDIPDVAKKSCPIIGPFPLISLSFIVSFTHSIPSTLHISFTHSILGLTFSLSAIRSIHSPRHILYYSIEKNYLEVKLNDLFKTEAVRGGHLKTFIPVMFT
jgi:hypothetical protein